MRTGAAVFTDFDGTVTTVDSLQRILTVFTGEAWRRIEDEVEAGRIGDRRSLQMEFDLVRASRVGRWRWSTGMWRSIPRSLRSRRG